MRRRFTLAALCLSSGVLALSARGGAAPDQTTFRSAVDLVDVEVSVLDRYRLPVRDLSAADFTVLEEGQPRPIVAFAPVVLPARVLPTAKWMDTIAPDVHSNAFPRQGRLVVILLDGSIDGGDATEARQIAEGAVRLLREGDMAAIAWSMPGVPQNFTSDRQRLLDVIRQPVLNVPQSITGGSGPCPCGFSACAMNAIASIAEGIQDVGGRRKVLLFVGRRLGGRGAGPCNSVVEAARARALRAAEVGNITFHVIDPHGLDTLAPSASVRGRPSPEQGGEVRRIVGLTSLTAPTGGRLVIRNQPSQVLPEVFRESDAYYVLGFPPAYTGTDGRFRRITVKVNRPDVTLQARRGYYAPGRPVPPPPAFGIGLPQALAASIAGVWPNTDVRMSLSAAPVAMPGVRGGAVLVLLRVVQDFTTPTPASGAAVPDLPRPTPVTVLTSAFDSNGSALGLDRQTATITPRRIGPGQFEYEVISRLQLKPGRYEIRAAVEDGLLGRIGSAYTYVDVPDFAGERVSLSGLFVQAGTTGSPAPGASVADLLPIRPTTRRVFERTEQVTAFVHEYQGQARMFTPGFATAEIIDSTDTRVYRQEQRVVPTTDEHRALDFSVNVPVDQLAPGAYVLTFEVRHGNDSARRDIRFDVR